MYRGSICGARVHQTFGVDQNEDVNVKCYAPKIYIIIKLYYYNNFCLKN